MGTFPGSWLRVLTTVPLLAVTPAAAQTVEVPRGYACAECRVHIRRIATLSPGPRAQPLNGSRVVRDARGFFYVAPTAERGVIAVHDSSGRFLRTLGRRGGGPGEFEEIDGIAIAPGDSLVVLHENRRFSVFTPEGEFARTFAVQAPGYVDDFRVLEDGRLLALLRPHSQIHFVDRDGASLSVLGEPRAPERYAEHYGSLAAGDGRVWAAYFEQHRIDGYGPDGRHRVFRSEPRWFARARERAEEERLRPPRVLQLEASPEGLLWVLSLRSTGWRPPAPAAPGGGEQAVRRLSVDESGDRFDWVLEAFDPEAGRAVTGTRFSEHTVGGLLDGETLYTYREDDLGVVHIDVWRLRMSGR